MPATEALARRLDTLGDLQSIVRTMKALAAASIRQYEEAARSVADYYHTVERGLQVVLSQSAPPPGGLGFGEARRPAAVVFGSDHGLCGRFNDDIVEHAVQRMQGIAPQVSDFRLVAVGLRAAARLEQLGQVVEEDFLVPGSRERIAATVQQILVKIDQWCDEDAVDHVYLFYNRRPQIERYRPTGLQLLPVDPARFRRFAQEPWPSRTLPMFTMDRDALFRSLLQQYFFVSVFRACADSLASEHASRLAAMESAERNLSDRVEEVLGAYRRERQTAITNELLDVVSGFEALSEPTNDSRTTS